MAHEVCEGCGETVTIAGGIANLWTLENDKTEGLTLDLADGSSYFLCYSCIERLPDESEVTAADVDALADEE